MELKINDKYSIVLNDGNDGNPFEFYATRYGERWRELAGDNLVLAMVYALENLMGSKDSLAHLLSFYGQNLQVYNWHLNGAPEPLDNFLVDSGGFEALEKLKELEGQQ